MKAVLSGDSFVVWTQNKNAQGTPEEVQITLSLLSAPRIARGKDAGTDQPWAWQSREALRKLIQAKVVQYRIDYTHPTSGRQYAFVKLQDGTNVNLVVAQSGWARVQEPKQGKGPRGSEHISMLDASQKAQDSKAGIFNDDVEASNRSIRDVKEKFDSWTLYDDIKERLPVHGVVEGVLDGSTVRILLVPSFYSVVVRLAGVQAPIWTRGESERHAQPFAEQAKYMTEYCLLGRDVSVHLGGVNKDETFYGTVLFGGKNVAEELLKNGFARFVQWSCPEADSAKFLQLEQQAQVKQLGVHKGASQQPLQRGPLKASGGGPNVKDFQGTVLDVRSGSRLTVEDDNMVLYDVFFSSVIAPKLNPKNPKEDEVCGFEAREFLRKKLIGKKVRVAFDYEKASRVTEEDGEHSNQPPAARKFYSVYLAGKHVPLMMVEQGLGQVITHRREEPRSREYSNLMAAEENSKKVKRGMWDPKHEVKRITDNSNLRGVQAKQYLKFVQKPEGLTAIVEFVMNPVRLKLFVQELSVYISFTVAAIRSPWGEDEFGDKACMWARRHLHQRKLEIHVSNCDKGGNFLGDAFFRKQNVALTLLEEGWAQLGKGSDKHSSFAVYQKAEQGAQAAKKGMWKNWTPNQAQEEVDTGKPLEVGNVLVTDVLDGNWFYCQRVGDTHQQGKKKINYIFSFNLCKKIVLQSLMQDCQKCGTATGVQGVKWGLNMVATVNEITFHKQKKSLNFLFF